MHGLIPRGTLILMMVVVAGCQEAGPPVATPNPALVTTIDSELLGENRRVSR